MGNWGLHMEDGGQHVWAPEGGHTGKAGWIQLWRRGAVPAWHMALSLQVTGCHRGLCFFLNPGVTC